MKYLYYPIAILLGVLTVTEFIPAFGWACNHVSLYQWVLYGMTVYFAVRMIPFVYQNEQWLQTFSHEFIPYYCRIDVLSEDTFFLC